MRRIPEKSILDKFCIDLCRVIEKHIEYIVVSGFVVISSWRARAMEDIDMIISRLDKESFIELYNNLIENGFVCM